MHKKLLRNILVIEPDPDLRTALMQRLSRNIWIRANVVTSSDHDMGLVLLKTSPDFYGIVIVNLGHSVPFFVDFIKAARAVSPQTLFILFTGSTAELPPEPKLDRIIRNKNPQALISRIVALVAPGH